MSWTKEFNKVVEQIHFLNDCVLNVDKILGVYTQEQVDDIYNDTNHIDYDDFGNKSSSMLGYLGWDL